MSANEPQPLGATTEASEISQRDATYLPPSELAIKYSKGLQAPSSVGRSTLIKTLESFYVRPRWLFVRVCQSDISGLGTG